MAARTKTAPPVEFFTMAEAARKLRISIDLVREAAINGALVGKKTPGGRRYNFTLEELMTWRASWPDA